MNADEIRQVVGGVIPPKDPKDIKVTQEEKEEISQMCPFYGPIVKGRVADIEGSDHFLDAMSETFGRIFRALKTAGVQEFVRDLKLSDLQEADEKLSSTGTGMLEAEYPMIDMHVPEQDTFGAGVRAAYGIVEFALKDGTVVSTVESQPLVQTRGKMAEELLASEEEPEAETTVVGAAPIPSGSDNATAGPSEQDNSGSGHEQVMMPPKIFIFSAVEDSGQWIVSWPTDGHTVRQLNDMVQMIASLFGDDIADRVTLTTSGDRVVCHFTVEKKHA